MNLSGESANGQMAVTARHLRGVRLTGHGRFLLIVSGVLYLASLTSQSGLLLLPIGLLLGCYAVNFLAARAAVARLGLEAPSRTYTAEGLRLNEPWRVINRTSRAASFITAEMQSGLLFRLATVGAQAVAMVTPALLLPRRGVYPHTEIRFSSTFPFGLIRVARPVPLTGEIVVHPALYVAPAPRTAGMDPIVGGKHAGHRHTLSGSDFAGVRPMRGGDPFKHIHWKASSKGQGLMVKTFQEELSGRIGFLVDCGHTGDPKALDDCLRAAGSLMFAALDEGHHLEWVDLEHAHAELIPPFSDGQEILDRLARIKITRNCLARERLSEAASLLSRKTAICLVLTTINDSVRELVNEWVQHHRVVSVYLPAALSSVSADLACPVFFYTEQEVLAAA